MIPTRILASLSCACIVAASAQAQLRIATWNVTNYASGRIPDFQTVYYGTFQGRQFAPDVLLGQEFVSQASVNNFVSLLNNAAGSPGDWAAAPFTDGPDSDVGFFYRTSRVVYVSTTIVSYGGASPEPPRNTYRHTFRPVGMTGNGATIAAYNVHMKSGSAGTDQTRRLLEAQRIRTDAENLPAGTNFLVAGDFNIQSSNQAAYQELIGSQVLNTGRFWDPINSPGSWNNSSSYRFIHTQDPLNDMDDRLDLILTSENLIDGDAFHYIGNPNLAYSNTTWNDPNHSYRCWGNDGTSYGNPIAVASNTMVGPTIAQAILNTIPGTTGGHLPVFLDTRVPPTIQSTLTVDFGTVPLGYTAVRPLQVWNSGDTLKWGANGVAFLRYSFSVSGSAFAPGGTFSSAAGGTTNSHNITLDTSTPGLKMGTITVLSNDPAQPAKQVKFFGRVLGRLGG